NNAQGSPAVTHSCEQWLQQAGAQIQLVQFDFVPGNLRIGLHRWFALLASVVHWGGMLLGRAAYGMFDRYRPCLLRFDECDRFGMKLLVTPLSRLYSKIFI